MPNFWLVWMTDVMRSVLPSRIKFATAAVLCRTSKAATRPLPDALGAEISQGSWERALANDNGNRATAHLLDLLWELDIAPGEVRPRLAAELHRERYDITDKGRNWFELDRELWSFHPFEDADRVVQLQDFVVDTRLTKEDPELIRRVVTLNRLSEMTYGVHATTRSPYERAIEKLGFGP